MRGKNGQPESARQGRSMEVKLTLPEIMMAGAVATMRRGESTLRGCVDRKYHAGDHASWDTEVDGAAAELAYCKARNQYWGGTVNSFHGPDVGSAVQIRQTWRPNGRLIVRDDDNDDHYFVLVVGTVPVFTVVGWILGKDAKNDEWFDSPNGKPPAWFVPQENLNAFRKR